MDSYIEILPRELITLIMSSLTDIDIFFLD